MEAEIKIPDGWEAIPSVEIARKHESMWFQFSLKNGPEWRETTMEEVVGGAFAGIFIRRTRR